MSEPVMFSCRECHWYKISVISDHIKCTHPCIADAHLEGTGLRTYTDTDWGKINLIVNEILDLDITLIDGKVENFDFPEKFDDVWVTACKGFKQLERRKGTNKITSDHRKNQNVDVSMGD